MTASNEFKLIVAGGRDFNDYAHLVRAIRAIAEGDLADRAVSIVSGMARGADRMAYDFANLNGVVVHEFPADWDRYGKAAGYRRNADMAAFSDGLLAFWDGKSRGTQNMIDTMKKLGKPVSIIHY